MALSLSIPTPSPRRANGGRPSCLMHGVADRDRVADFEIKVTLAALIAGDLVL